MNVQIDVGLSDQMLEGNEPYADEDDAAFELS